MCVHDMHLKIIEDQQEWDNEDAKSKDRIHKPCMEIMFCFFVKNLAILIAVSTASDPEFQKKNELSEGCGIAGRRRSMRRRYGSCIAMLHYRHSQHLAWTFVKETHLGMNQLHALICSCFTDFSMGMSWMNKSDDLLQRANHIKRAHRDSLRQYRKWNPTSFGHRHRQPMNLHLSSLFLLRSCQCPEWYAWFQRHANLGEDTNSFEITCIEIQATSRSYSRLHDF